MGATNIIFSSQYTKYSFAPNYTQATMSAPIIMVSHHVIDDKIFKHDHSAYEIFCWLYFYYEKFFLICRCYVHLYLYGTDL